MNSKQRLIAAMKGEEVDRAPLWPREGFRVLGQPSLADDFSNGWQSEPLYHELHKHVKPHGDEFAGFGIPGINRHLVVPESSISWETILDTPEKRQQKMTIDTPKGKLEEITEKRHWQATTWHLKEAVRSVEELEMLASIPYELDTRAIAEARNGFLKVREEYGETHALRGWVSSPMVCISGAMPLEMFLEMSFTHKAWFFDLCEENTKRILAICKEFFTDDIDWTDVTMTLGGSEQCTPPLMPPTSYDELVMPFDGQIIDFFKSKGMLVSVHCHGKVSHALKCMLQMGVDGTDPVEPPPAGDVTFREAQEISEGKITLMGNMELDVLENGTTEQIKEHVKDMFKNGNKRIIVSASAGPMEPVSRKFVDNYKAFVDAVLEYGS